MNNKIKNIVTTVLLGGILIGLAIFSWVKPADEYSMSERRYLVAFPDISKETILSGDAMSGFETYAVDQFPMRDSFRRLKALTSRYVFLQKENNGNFYEHGYAAKLEYPLNEESVNNATEHFTNVYNKFLKDTNSEVYLSVIPDKSYFMAEANGYPSMDYDKMIAQIREKLSFMEYIDIFPFLDQEDYYKTDTHWKQECITDVAAHMTGTMGSRIPMNYTENVLDRDFYGVYYGQLMLPMPPEKITYLTNENIDSMTAFDYENNVEMDIYDFEMGDSPDPYSMYLKGPLSLVTVQNPSATTDKELVIFRDSFGSSIGPLLAQGYAKTTFVDIRYISSNFLGRFVDFNDCDVLFMYSTSLFNSSDTLK